MRVALAGLGGASLRGHLPALARLGSERRLKLVGAADPNPIRRAAVGSQLGGVPVFESAEAMLEGIRSDVLIIAAQPSVHARLAILGANHRQHVVCEKPLTLTREHQHAVISAYADRPDLGVVSVHQYRYSPTWVAASRWGRVASRLGVPFELTVDVERNGADRHAAMPWRLDAAGSGGMLADHGVHFLALGWTISEDLEVLGVSQTWDAANRERSLAELRLGSGRFDVSVWAGAPGRRTRVDLRAPSLEFSWTNASALLMAGRRPIRRWRTDALSDRRHVDSLYLPFYRDLIANLREGSWRMRQRAEALAVSSALITLLEHIRGERREA